MLAIPHSEIFYGSNYGSIAYSHDAGRIPIEPSQPVNANHLRWFVMVHVTLVFTMTMFVTLFYGSVSVSVSYAFGWTPLTFELFTIWALLAYYVVFFPALWSINKYSSRFFMTVVSFANFLSCLLHCFPGRAVVTPLSHISAFIGNAASSVMFYYPLAMAQEFFPPHEWNLAIGTTMMVPQSGSLATFLMAVAVIPEPNYTTDNSDNIVSSVMNVNYVTTAISAVLLLGAAFYPRAEPYVADHRVDTEVPSLSSALRDSKLVLSTPIFWLATFRYLFSAINMTLMTIWPLYLHTKGLSQSVVGVLLVIDGGLIVVIGVFLGWLCDKKIQQRRHKTVLLVLAVIYFAGCVTVLMTNDRCVAAVGVSASIIAGNVSYGVLFAVASREIAVPGATTSSWIMSVAGLVSILFYVVTKLQHNALAWVSYYQVVSGAVTPGLPGHRVKPRSSHRGWFSDPVSCQLHMDDEYV